MKQERQPMLSRASCTHNEEHRSLGRSRLNFSIWAGVAAHPAGGNGAGWVHGTGRAKLCAPVQAAAVCVLMAPSLCLRQPCCQQEAGQTLADSHGITTISISTSHPCSQCLGDAVSLKKSCSCHCAWGPAGGLRRGGCCILLLLCLNSLHRPCELAVLCLCIVR